MSAPRLGDRPLTNAERQDRWRKRHAARLARKAARRGGHTTMTPEDFATLVPTMEEFRALFVAPDEWKR